MGIFQRMFQVLIPVVALAGLGLILRPVELPAWEVVRARQPNLQLDQLNDALGQGLIVGVVGGLRSIVADFVWIRLNTVWENKDPAALDRMIQLVTTLDARSKYFWINSARMLAYDVPHWRVQQAGGIDDVPPARQDAIARQQVEQAFKILDDAIRYHPDAYEFPQEIAQIYMNRLNDKATAAEWFLKAWEMGAPYYTARMHAELLQQVGRPEEAYAFLRTHYEEIPEDDPMAMKGVVFQRLRELEDSLDVPEILRLRETLVPE